MFYEGFGVAAVAFPDKLEVPGRSDFYLQLATLDDAEDWHHLVTTNPNIREVEDWADGLSVEDAKRRTYRAIDGYHMGQVAPYRMIAPGAGVPGDMVGAVGVYGRDVVGRTAQLGYYQAQSSVDKGRVTAAASTLLGEVKKRWDLREVRLLIQPSNVRSRAVACRLGAQCTSEAVWIDMREGPTVHSVWRKAL